MANETKTTFTPGPWTLEEGSAEEDGQIFDALVVVATATPDEMITAIPSHDAEALANARLIAAAPDMLAVCQRLIRAIGVNGPLLSKLSVDAQKAIDKATGAPA